LDIETIILLVFFFSSRRRHTRFSRDWSSDVCSSDLPQAYRKRVGYPDTILCISRRTPRISCSNEGLGRCSEGRRTLMLLFHSHEIGRASCRERVYSTEGA